MNTHHDNKLFKLSLFVSDLTECVGIFLFNNLHKQKVRAYKIFSISIFQQSSLEPTTVYFAGYYLES